MASQQQPATTPKEKLNQRYQQECEETMLVVVEEKGGEGADGVGEESAYSEIEMKASSRVRQGEEAADDEEGDEIVEEIGGSEDEEAG